ncbi:MAG: hypothetical protein A2096_05035 [Spirochaetes bacterium GWF1_41_5]|nr:MAG: hypothetical protein A2096_05035 [Spirochaetes bacterium GWF1_41_5]
MKIKNFEPNSYYFHYKDNLPVKPVSVGYSIVDNENYCWTDLQHNKSKTIIFQYTVSGCGYLTTNNKTFKLGPRRAFIVRYDEQFKYFYKKNNSTWEFFHFTFHDAGDALLSRYFHFLHNRVFSLDEKSPPILVLKNLFGKLREKSINDADTLSLAGYAFLLELKKFFSRRATADSHFINKINRLISQNIKGVSVRQLADNFGYSYEHFSRCFKRESGVTPVDYLVKKRIEEAMNQLVSSELPVKIIADNLGFNDNNYFCKVFKKISGYTPTFFRQNYSEELRQKDIIVF